jgi:glutaredoxin-dependent peroxiredoxin
MRPHTGEQAPGFSLFNHDKKEVSLMDQKGRNVVLLFFPLAFTSTCTAELCHIRDTFSAYNSLDATVYGISVDSHYALRKFREEQGLNFDLLSDFNKEASKSYNCLYEKFGANMLGVSKRAVFVIDKTGVLRYSEVLENASLQPNYDSILNCLQSLN